MKLSTFFAVLAIFLIIGGIFGMVGYAAYLQKIELASVTPTIEPFLSATRTPTTAPTPRPLVTTSNVVVIAQEALHVRKCAAASCEVVNWLVNGDEVIIDSCSGEWGRLAGTELWVNADFVSPNPCQ